MSHELCSQTLRLAIVVLHKSKLQEYIFFLFIILAQCSHYCSLLLSEQKHFPTLFVRVCRALSCSPSWSIREVPRVGTTTPALNPSLMASGTVSMTSMSARSVSTTGSSRILRMKRRASLSQVQMSFVFFFSTSYHQHCLISLFLVDEFYFLDRSPQRISERLTGGPQGAEDIIPVPLQGWFCIFLLACFSFYSVHLHTKWVGISLICTFFFSNSSTNAYMLIYRLKDPSRNASKKCFSLQ